MKSWFEQFSVSLLRIDERAEGSLRGMLVVEHSSSYAPCSVPSRAVDQHSFVKIHALETHFVRSEQSRDTIL